MANILIVSASTVKNLEMANSFQEKLTVMGAKAKILNLVELDLPLYSALTEKKFEGHKLLGSWWEELQTAHGFVFLAPEYNGGIPPVFTNFLAWVSRSSKNWRECLNGKTAVIGTFSGGGGQTLLMAMRLQLSFIGVNVIGRQIIAHSAKPMDEGSLSAVCEQLMIHAKS